MFFGEICGLPSQEGSGLKHGTVPDECMGNMSSLARGKWIEAETRIEVIEKDIVFPRKREVDRSTHPAAPRSAPGWSSLARGKWIEAFRS